MREHKGAAREYGGAVREFEGAEREQWHGTGSNAGAKLRHLSQREVTCCILFGKTMYILYTPRNRSCSRKGAWSF